MSLNLGENFFGDEVYTPNPKLAKLNTRESRHARIFLHMRCRARLIYQERTSWSHLEPEVPLTGGGEAGARAPVQLDARVARAPDPQPHRGHYWSRWEDLCYQEKGTNFPNFTYTLLRAP